MNDKYIKKFKEKFLSERLQKALNLNGESEVIAVLPFLDWLSKTLKEVRGEYESPNKMGLSKKDILRITAQSSIDQMKAHEQRIRQDTIREIAHIVIDYFAEKEFRNTNEVADQHGQFVKRIIEKELLAKLALKEKGK